MNPIERWFENILTKYAGSNWKTLVGASAFVLLWILQQVGLSNVPESIIEFLEMLAALLAGAGIYHKTARSMKLAEAAKTAIEVSKKE